MSRLFNGNVANRLVEAGTTAFDIVGTQITLAAWFKTTVTTLNQYLQCRLANLNIQYNLRLTNDGKVRVSVGNGGTSLDVLSTAGAYTAGAWQHAAGTKDGSVLTAYLNGVPTVGSSVQTIGSGGAPALFTVGSRSDSVDPMNGQIAQCALWDVPLTGAEIAALAKGVSPLLVRPKNLRGYLPLWAAATPEPDLGGTPFNVGVVGTVPPADHAPVGRYVHVPGYALA